MKVTVPQEAFVIDAATRTVQIDLSDLLIALADQGCSVGILTPEDVRLMVSETIENSELGLTAKADVHARSAAEERLVDEIVQSVEFHDTYGGGGEYAMDALGDVIDVVLRRRQARLGIDER